MPSRVNSRCFCDIAVNMYHDIDFMKHAPHCWDGLASNMNLEDAVLQTMYARNLFVNQCAQALPHHITSWLLLPVARCTAMPLTMNSSGSPPTSNRLK